jgi:hypothetical protein
MTSKTQAELAQTASQTIFHFNRTTVRLHHSGEEGYIAHANACFHPPLVSNSNEQLRMCFGPTDAPYVTDASLAITECEDGDHVVEPLFGPRKVSAAI